MATVPVRKRARPEAALRCTRLPTKRRLVVGPLPWLRSGSSCIAGAAIIVLPFLWMLGTSFKPESDVFGYPLRLQPTHPDVVPITWVFGRHFLSCGWS